MNTYNTKGENSLNKTLNICYVIFFNLSTSVIFIPFKEKMMQEKINLEKVKVTPFFMPNVNMYSSGLKVKYKKLASITPENTNINLALECACSVMWGPMDYSLPGFSVHGISQAGILK